MKIEGIYRHIADPGAIPLTKPSDEDYWFNLASGWQGAPGSSGSDRGAELSGRTIKRKDIERIFQEAYDEDGSRSLTRSELKNWLMRLTSDGDANNKIREAVAKGIIVKTENGPYELPERLVSLRPCDAEDGDEEEQVEE